MIQDSQNKKAQNLYLYLCAIFIASLVACNLIFQKFFSWQPFSWASFGASPDTAWYGLANYTFEISVGIIPYPITFLVTDLISEIFGRKKANQVVIAGLFATLFVLLIILLANGAEATSWSPVSDNTFTQVFGLTGVAVTASMVAYLLAQLVDVRLFHFWKELTKGKHLWLRNNFSTILSQLVDTSTVLLLLCATGVIAWDKFGILLFNGFLFKVIMALFDTPIFYLLTFWARKTFNLRPGEEIGIE
jgi:uncharacterized integral membrane protein (TIGR00697 family)